MLYVVVSPLLESVEGETPLKNNLILRFNVSATARSKIGDTFNLPLSSSDCIFDSFFPVGLSLLEVFCNA